MLKKLARQLRDAREASGWPLEAVAKPAKISAAYLHKLEKGVVNSPSPRVLARIGNVLELDYLQLLELAGYLDEAQLAAARARTPAPHPHPLAGQQLSSAEWKAVGAFIQQLIAQRDT